MNVVLYLLQIFCDRRYEDFVLLNLILNVNHHLVYILFVFDNVENLLNDSICEF